MGIKLVTFAAQTVTPQDDALIYETALQESGMIYGGTVTIKNANVLHVAAGHGALCGRKFTIEETDVAVGLTPSGSLLGRIYIHMDLSDTDEPISFQTETANSLTPVIQQSDVNINNGVYEINLATFTVDTSTISNLVNVAPFIDISPDSEFSASSNNPLMNKAITKAIGDPETIGGSASQPYTKGALLLATDGQIYEVTQNIALHGSIVNGGNVSPTGNIISQISNLAQRYGITATRSAVNLAVCDGISNLDAYLNTARNSITNWLNNLDSNTYVHFDRLRIGSINIVNESAILLPKGGGYATAGASNFVISFIFNNVLCVYDANNFSHFYELNGSTFIDHGSEIPANGTVIAVDVTYYKKGI